jgi:hypothetical protein
VAKKRKGARSATTRGAKKKPVRKAAVKKAVRRKGATAARKSLTGLESQDRVDFGPLKAQINAHMERLTAVKDRGANIERALESLRQVQTALTSECSPTMVINFA